jgi:hypothetical protein
MGPGPYIYQLLTHQPDTDDEYLLTRHLQTAALMKDAPGTAAKK